MDNNKILEYYGNPSVIQYDILSGLENFTGKDCVITTPDNVATFLIESFGSITANAMQGINSKLQTFFPQRINTLNDLFKHMSDYTYAGLYSYPAVAEIEIHIFKETIKKESVYYHPDVDKYPSDFNNSGTLPQPLYKKIVIPANTSFNIGGVIFSNYYPIEIRYGDTDDYSKTKGLTILYDNSELNALYPLTNAHIEHQIYNNMGLDIVTMKINVSQFVVTEHFTDLFEKNPYKKQFKFDDKFYAIRAFTNKQYGTENNQTVKFYKGEYWTELKQVLDSNVFDVSTDDVPSVVIEPNIKDNIVGVSIPQIFISEGNIGGKLFLEIYTTKGKIDLVMPDESDQEITGVFKFSGNEVVDQYSHAFHLSTNINIYTTGTRIVGGTNGLSFDEIRSIVVNGNANDTLIITPGELENLFTKIGFSISKFKDGITDRIFLCHKELTDYKDKIIPSGNIAIGIDTLNAKLTSNIKSDFPDGSITILPSAIFKYDRDKNICLPVPDTDTIYNGSDDELLLLNNTNTYIKSPFFVNVFVNNGTPLAHSYNFIPEVISSHVKSLSESTYLVYLTAIDVTFNENTDCFIFKLQLETSTDNNDYTLNANVKLPIKEGGYVGHSASYSRITDPTTHDVTDELGELNNTIEVQFKTNYHFNSNGDINLEAISSTGVIGSGIGHTDLETNMEINLSIDVNNGESISSYESSIKLCDIIEEIFNVVNMTASDAKPKLYEFNIPARYTEDRLLTFGEIGDDSHNAETPWYESTENGINFKYLARSGEIIYKDSIEKTLRLTKDNISDFENSLLVEDFNRTGKILIDPAYVIVSQGTSTTKARVAYKNNIITRDMITQLLQGSRTVTITSDNIYDWEGALKVIDYGETIAPVSSDYVIISQGISGGINAKVAYLNTELTSAMIANILNGIPVTGWVLDTQYDLYLKLENSNILKFENYTSKDFTFNEYYDIIQPSFEHVKGTPIISSTGEIEYSERCLEYNVSSIVTTNNVLYRERVQHINDSGTVIDDVRNKSIGYCNLIKSSKDRLFPNTSTYYVPNRSIGNALCKTNTKNVINHSLELSLAFKLFVSNKVINDTDLQNIISDSLITIIHNNLKNKVFSQNRIGDELIKLYSGEVVSVDMLGINNDTEIQTLTLLEEDVSLSIKLKLIKNEYNKLEAVEDISIEYISYE